MRKIFDVVKDTTKIGIQFVKEKTGIVHSQDSPEFLGAKQIWITMKKEMDEFYKNMNEILNCFGSLSNHSIKVSKELSKIDPKESNNHYNSQQANVVDNDVVDNCQLFFEKTNALIKENILDSMTKNVLKQIYDTRDKIQKIQNLEKKREKVRLLTESYRDKAAFQIDARRNFDANNQKLMQITQHYIESVNVLWSARNDKIEGPIRQFLALIFAFLQAEVSNVQELQVKNMGHP